MVERLKVFISRAGPDAAIAAELARILDSANFAVLLQDTSFRETNFMVRMHDALRDADRVLALLSDSYMSSDHCLAELANALADDPLNRRGRLVVLRVDDCSPSGILSGIPYHDIAGLLGDSDALRQMLLKTLAGVTEANGHRSPLCVNRSPVLHGSVVTIVLGEIEDSAERWSRQPGSMRTDVERLNVGLRAICEDQGGRVFLASAGAFTLVFPEASSAFIAAAQLQRSLQSGEIGASVALKQAIHSGRIERLGQTIVGEAAARAASLLSRVYGGDILASAAAANLAAATLPEGVSLVDLGAHKREGQEQPEHIYQVALPGVEHPSPLKGEHLTNLRGRPTSFIGRGREVAELGELVGFDRMVTLFGFGGVGKTRIALEVGTKALGSYSDGVWFIQFASVSEPEMVVDTVTAALGIRSDGSKFSLGTALRSRHLLLIFDNCEHLAMPIAGLVAQLLAECPEVSVLATSRQPLGVDGETLFRIEPLGAPPQSSTLDAPEAASYESVQLFVERAHSVDRRFALTSENAAAVARLCAKLEGIPLAIELAAARVNILRVDDLLARLDDRFKLLKRTSVDSAARHQTLRATIDWSFDLLPMREKELFRRLAIFVGGWSLDAAEFVCQGESVGVDVLEGLSSLVDKSLVTFDSAANPSRYAFLETTRAYALEKLAESDDAAEMASRRAHWFAAFADEMYERFSTSQQPKWLARVLPEIDNLRTSLRWALDDRGDLETAGRIAGGLSPLWQARGVGEGRLYVERILAQRDAKVAPKVEALLWLTLAGTTVAKRKVDAADAASALYTKLSDSAGQAESLRYRAEGLRQMKRLGEATEALDRASILFRELGLVEGPSYSALLQTRALLLANAECYTESVAVFGEAMRRFEAIEDEPAIAGAKCQLAEVEFWAGNVTRALELGDEAIEICKRLGDAVKEAAMTVNVAAYRLLAGDVEAASAAAREALELSSALGISFYVTLALQHLGTVAALNGDEDRGRLLLSYVDQWLATEGFEREATEQRTYDLGVEALGRQGDARPLAAEPSVTSEEEAIAQARYV